MVVEGTTKHRGGTGSRVGGKGARGTSKKNKQQEDQSESSEGDTKEEASVAERTKRTLREAELKATATFLQAREYLDSNKVKAIIHHYGANTRRELGLITRAQISEEILTGETVLKGRKISRLQGSKISLLLTEIEMYLRGEFQWDADGDVLWETDIPLLTPSTPCVHTLASSEKTHSGTSALTQILPDHLVKWALTQLLPDHLVTGVVPSVSAHIVPSVGVAQKRGMGDSMHDEEDTILIKSNNTSDPHARCRDHVEEEGLGTGERADAEEMRTCHEWRELLSPIGVDTANGRVEATHSCRIQTDLGVMTCYYLENYWKMGDRNTRYSR